MLGKNGDKVAILWSDGTTGTAPRADVAGWLQPISTMRIVDEVLTKIGKSEHQAFVNERLRWLGMVAVPERLRHL